MEKLRFHQLHTPLFALLFYLLHFSSLQFLSMADYSLPDKYFINCGSATNVYTGQRNFVGDLNSGDSTSNSISFTDQNRVAINSDQSSTASPLYQTARVFLHNSSYEFDIDTNGTYFVRLHFFAFSSPSTPTDLSTALFDVWTSGFSLLLNFTAKTSSDSPIIKEFLLSILNPGKFKVYFVPRGSSFAFINAMEVFLAPDDLINDTARHVTAAGSTNDYKGVLSKALHTIYRINVGGPNVTPESDTLLRNWVPDSDYIYNPDKAKVVAQSSSPSYNPGFASRYTAPDPVYQTAQTMDTNSTRQADFFNITWGFNVRRNARHLVRVHFCDIVGITQFVLSFNLYIYSKFSRKVDSNDFGGTSVPFFLDFVVDSDNSGTMNISIGPRIYSSETNAYLNGLEIMEILDTSGSVPAVSEHKNKHVFLVVVSVLGGLVLIGILAVGFFLVFKRRKQMPGKNSDWSPIPVFGVGSTHSRATEGSINGSPLPNFNLALKVPLTEILDATNNFDTRLLIGKGGFGNVYKGTLRHGQKIAVKRSEPGSNQGFPEFQTEIMVLSKIRHRHLVSLIGYCEERSEMILVYEFMEKGTLKDHIYASNLPRLSWKQRLEICIGAARGLQYLHKGSAGGIIHRDVKSTNILLDEHYVAKVADFGLSKTGPLDETHVSTIVKGTFGYLDPEYIRSQQLTEKSDVYAFGVVLLEVLCARPAINAMLSGKQVNLAEWAMLCKKEGTLEEIVDPSLKGQIDPNSQRRFIETAEKCLQELGADRPTMDDVVWDLEYALQLQQTAMRREPHEDSSVLSGLALPNVQRLPSFSITMDESDMPVMMDDGSYVEACDVFSQMKIDDAR
ncbi:LOW QUALITY PROTEIN: probable receptor-like protein kinase At2g23200 [Juglans microcarpa x Juglans regia]|uniref:LOW QUALITY PROTEIN: probable receptor-like protein kinase At2g23200 n=1 Tax=Juglans microcarpa x Juglans regia TaxID=2249226 RepID=UPI001B7F1E4C|nr:LOW QUALITY PROTEIN: probable receptor-like protein kinase At2g23200 [Juglans microcarpa x Juglans regia]